MASLTIGVLGTSRKDGDLRRPIHPRHIDRIEPDIRPQLFFEHGYGDHFDVGDEHIEPEVGGLRSREELIAGCDVILLPKPTHADVAELRNRQTLWGWPHCVQDETVTQLAIDNRLTLIAWEAMNHWRSDGSFSLHVFHKNNEIAGYSSVMHALQLTGRAGHYGPHLRALIISHGATARGAITALHGLGVYDVTVVTQRPTTAVASPEPGLVFGQFRPDDRDPTRTVALKSTGAVPMAAFLADFDIVVNCVFQDPASPLMFVMNDDLALFQPGTVFVDVSCDEGMGFEFARPTTFAEPMFEVAPTLRYYGVDHSPSYLWNAATWEISLALLPYLRPMAEGSAAWNDDETIRRAIEIRDGVIQNPMILAFQNRDAAYPHPRSS